MHKFVSMLGSLAALLAAAPSHAQVAYFDAATDTIQIAGQTQLGTAATFEARVLLLPGGGGTVYFEQADGREHKQLALSETSVGGIGFTLPTNQTSLNADVAVSTGVFHHIAFVRDGGEERIYLDGLRVARRTVQGDIDDDSSTAPAVGAQMFQNTSFMTQSFIGLLDTLRISNVARYNGASFTAPTGDLGSDSDTLLLYNFNAAELAGNQLADLSGNGHTGTLGAGFAGATAPELLSAVPEPDSWALMLAGAAALALRLRRASKVNPKPRGHRMSRSMTAAAACSLLALAAPAFADVTSEPAPTGQINAVSFFGQAAVLAGVRVTASFTDGTTSSALFTADTGAVFAQTSLFIVTARDLSSRTTFEVIAPKVGTSLLGIRFDGLGDGAGAAAFDRLSANIGGADTQGSNDGSDLFADFTSLPNSVKNGASFDVVYRNALGLNGAAPAGDLFRSVELRFHFQNLPAFGNGEGLAGGQTFSIVPFDMDMDSVSYISSVPEPGAALLMFGGGLALLARRLRRPR